MYERAWAAFVSGDLEAAARAASSHTRFATRGPGSRWVWSLRLLHAEVLDAQSNWNAERELLRAPVPADPAFGPLEVRRQIDLAVLGVRTKDAAGARRALDEAAAAVRDPEMRIRLALAEGLSAATDHPDAARQSFGAAAALAAQAGFPYWQAQALNNLSYALKRAARYEESIEAGQMALAAAEKLGARRVAALAHGNLGSAYAILGDFENAIGQERQAIDTFRDIGARANMMIALGELGLAYDGAGDLPQAVANHQAAFDLALAMNRKDDAARHAENLSLALIKAREWDRAAEWNQRASALARELDAEGNLPYLERNRASIALGRGDAREAARICHGLLESAGTPPSLRWVAWAMLGDIESDARHPAEADRCLEQALRIIESTRKGLFDSGHRITLLSELMPFYQLYVDVLCRQKNDQRAMQVVESGRARVLAEGLELDDSAAPRAGAPQFERVARQAHASILSFWLAPERSFAWLISSGGVQRFDLPGSETVEKLVTAYRETVEHSVRDPLKNPAGAALWQHLIAPVAAHLHPGERLIVIPDGALYRLNLETLVTPAPQPHYWIDDIELAVAPSIAILASSAPGKKAEAPSLLVIGAPDYAGSRYRPLANAEREIREIQASFSGRVQQAYLRAQATPNVYRQADPRRYSLIHFAAHAEANAEKPLESAVILSRGKLYARDVLGIPIRADLVTISSCSSAGSRTYAGEGLVGFAWAFMRAGARAVVAGLWDVSDSSTEQLMNGFYRRLAAGAAPVTAMRQAKLELLREPDFARPYYWAPFQVYVAAMGQ